MSLQINSTGPMPAPTPPARRVPAWLREPLLHFAVLGALLFALDHALVAKADDPRLIVVGPEVDRQARDTFRAARGAEPDAQQLSALRQAWLDNEVLYREGRALRVDEGDTTVRERIIFKALNIVEAGLKAPVADDEALRAWFESHRDKYDEPARWDFQEAVLPENTEQAVRAFVAELNSGTGSTRAGLRVFKGRPHANLVQGYGADAARALEEAPAGEWRAIATRDGWRAMRVEAVAAPRPASYEVQRNVVLQDWTDAKMSELRTAAVRELARKYQVRFEGARP